MQNLNITASLAFYLIFNQKVEEIVFLCFKTLLQIASGKKKKDAKT